MDCLIGLGWNVLPFVCIRKCRLKASDGIFADAVFVPCRFARPSEGIGQAGWFLEAVFHQN
ncbi:TPA: hypothetical protein ACFNM0_001112 [Neisseria lactamica]